ncbi:MAG: N-acetylmuramic acid 6-phosphate etherase [Devosia sp.]|nr:N-acetylmuramic acid 6-phosphate etherase [Devosia sp.]
MTAATVATEAVEARYEGFDTWNANEILSALLEGHTRALRSVEAAIPALAAAAQLAADKLRGGGRLIYIASGSPALMSMADALEIPQTYGIAYDRIVLMLADGKDIATRLNGMREDRGDEARAEVAAAAIGPRDCVIGTSASGTTPYTLEGIIAAREAGAATIGIAGNVNSPLLQAAEIPVLLNAGPEVISGSTRMGAGTAQKAALNMLSTLMGVHLGHVYDGLMVNVKADNEKLRGRAARIVSKVTGTNLAVAASALEQSGGEVKPAILIAAGVGDLSAAEGLLGQAEGNVRSALAALAAASRAQH